MYRDPDMAYDAARDLRDEQMDAILDGMVHATPKVREAVMDGAPSTTVWKEMPDYVREEFLRSMVWAVRCGMGIAQRAAVEAINNVEVRS